MSSTADTGSEAAPSPSPWTGQNRSTSLPLLSGTIGPDVVDIRKLYGDLGVFTFDPGYGATASCESKITYIDGDEGVLLYRGYPIEQLAEKSDFLEVCLPAAERRAAERGAARGVPARASCATPCCTSRSAASSTASAAMRTRWR